MLFIDVTAPPGQTTIPVRTRLKPAYSRSRIQLDQDFDCRKLRLLHYAYKLTDTEDGAEATNTLIRYFLLKVFVNGVVAHDEMSCLRESITSTTMSVHNDAIVLPRKATSVPMETVSAVGSPWGEVVIPQTTKQRVLEIEIWADPAYVDSAADDAFLSFCLWFDVVK